MLGRKRKIEKEYTFVEKETELGEQYAIKLKKGKFRDVVYSYGMVKLVEEDEGGLRLRFSYTVYSNPHGRDTDSEKFTNIIGQILEHLIDKEGDKIDYISQEEE